MQNKRDKRKAQSSNKDLYSKKISLIGGGRVLTVLWVEVNCPEHGFERFKIKVVKKFNVRKEFIAPMFRTRPKYELSGIVVGKDVEYREIKEYLMRYFRETGMYEKVLRIKMQY